MKETTVQIVGCIILCGLLVSGIVVTGMELRARAHRYQEYYEAGYKQAILDMENASKAMLVQNKIKSDEISHLLQIEN